MGDHTFTLQDETGRDIAVCGKAYDSAEDMETDIAVLMAGAADAEVVDETGEEAE